MYRANFRWCLPLLDRPLFPHCRLIRWQYQHYDHSITLKETELILRTTGPFKVLFLEDVI